MTTAPALDTIIKEVQENPFFIGSPSLLDKLDWEVGSGKNTDCLIVRRSADDDPDASSEEAVLTVVGRISEEKCKLLPCGGWTDRFGGHLSDAKASFILVTPRHRDLVPLWDPVLTAVAKLQDSKRSLAASIQNSILIDLENSTARGLKLRHKLFEPLDASSDNSDTATDDSSQAPRNWNLKTWPCESSEAKNALSDMLENKTHLPVPLRAYDVDGKLIAPADWLKKLQGAEVLVKFTVTHQWFGRAASPGTKKDNYYADIEEIHLLKPPRPTPTSPRKRARDESTQRSDASPSQKQKKSRKNFSVALLLYTKLDQIIISFYLPSAVNIRHHYICMCTRIVDFRAETKQLRYTSAKTYFVTFDTVPATTPSASRGSSAPFPCPFSKRNNESFTNLRLIMTNGSTVNPSEVGWQFVPQYYTFVNKQPNRLHCFYTKASTFIHGTEGEDGKPCYGQQEIHARITEIGFQDCKVFIHSVDAQSSAQGGIIIQVIGEMSNKGEQWRKFVQTFFLAEQPNGYFVLNDIFRFLKEDAVDDEPSQDEPPVQDAPTQEFGTTGSFPPPTAPQPEPEPAPSPSPAPVAAPEPEPETAQSPVVEEQVNGAHEPPAEPEPISGTAPEPATVEQVVPSPAPSTPAPAAQPSPAPPVTPAAPPSAAPPSAAQPPVVSAPAATPVAPTPAAPPVRKTWANLAAAGSQKWGANVAEAKGVSEAPASTSSPAPTATSQSPVPRQLQNQHPAYTAAQNVNTAHCFVKGVVESVSDAALKNTLTQRFGPIKEIEIVRSKACAFLEFNTLESAKRAITTSLPVNAGGEGGIRIGEGSADGPPARIFVETRKERSERGPPRGPSVNGDRGRGGFRGRGASRGRGIPPQK